VTLVIVTPIQEELDSLAYAIGSRGLSGTEQRIGQLQGFSYCDGKVALVHGGLGKTQFAVQTQHVIDRLAEVEAVICAGVAGALSDALSIGDVVISTTTVEHDFNWKGSLESQPTFPGHGPYLSTIRELALQDRSFHIHFGPVASGDEGIVDAYRARELYDVTGVLAVAWEGAGGARATAFSGVPYLEVRGISDLADDRAAEVWEKNLPYAMKNVATVLFEIIHRVVGK